MDPYSGLWNCAISTLIQRSSGDQLPGSDLYQELRLKAKSSFRSRDRLSKAIFHTASDNASQAAEIVSGVHGPNAVAAN
ncbi:hypothetical protein TNCT_279451 [Trichonephila clavata]|uniref:Uncharacterized protein n=1 Tax=Trichonephila clavata TaxID=2740835 RepID=A0A8X6JE93_TRICU|nr:hypothetical protein TNCT_279451 [Trichonephila clavata]